MFLRYPTRMRGLHGRIPQHSGINHRPGEEKPDMGLVCHPTRVSWHQTGHCSHIVAKSWGMESNSSPSILLWNISYVLSSHGCCSTITLQWWKILHGTEDHYIGWGLGLPRRPPPTIQKPVLQEKHWVHGLCHASLFLPTPCTWVKQWGQEAESFYSLLPLTLEPKDKVLATGECGSLGWWLSDSLWRVAGHRGWEMADVCVVAWQPSSTDYLSSGSIIQPSTGSKEGDYSTERYHGGSICLGVLLQCIATLLYFVTASNLLLCLTHIKFYHSYIHLEKA